MTEHDPKDDAGQISDDAFRDQVRQANAGDPAAIAKLRIHLDAHPEIWQSLGSATVQAREKWIELLAGGDWLQGESIRRRQKQIVEELVRPGESRLELVLAERLALDLLQLLYAELKLADPILMKAMGIDQLEERVHRAHARVLASAKALAMVRKYLHPKPVDYSRYVGGPNGVTKALVTGTSEMSATATNPELAPAAPQKTNSHPNGLSTVPVIDPKSSLRNGHDDHHSHNGRHPRFDLPGAVPKVTVAARRKKNRKKK